ncbi:hypothetical protein AAVH_34831 [Aphelenchoides avenae]|nr:hypothetical protein AAVH_34831 [Aphelenchus avenae]
MTFTEQQATEILDQICKAFEEAHKTKDAKRMAQLYHPRATMIHVGVKCDYGREGSLYLSCAASLCYLAESP